MKRQTTPTRRTLFLAACSICPEIIQRRAEHPRSCHAEQDLWTELVACILGSRVRYETATAALRRLLRAGLLELDYLAGNVDATAEEIAAALRELPGTDGASASYPFPNIRARHICESYGEFYRHGACLGDLLRRHESALLMRRQLVAKAAGIGAKQASLFLRNVGHSDDLAVLDVHVLRYMRLMGLRESEEPPRSLRAYENTEECLRSHAGEAGYSLGSFDYAVWVVMRTFRPPVGMPLCAS